MESAIAIIVTIIIGILIVEFNAILRVLRLSHLSGQPHVKRVLIMGHSGAGKTALFAALQYNPGPGLRKAGLQSNGERELAKKDVFNVKDTTITSVEPNRDVFCFESDASEHSAQGGNADDSMNHHSTNHNSKKNGSFEVDIVDVPGHPRLRVSMLSKASIWRNIVGIIFVVDSVNFMKDARVTTELLYEILTHKSIHRSKGSRTQIMICCNKSEKVTAYSGDFVRKRLEKELNAVRSSRASLRDIDDSSDSSAVILGDMGLAYSFDQGPYQVTTATVSVQKDNLTPVTNFIRKCVT